jgi:hypothetical protein
VKYLCGFVVPFYVQVWSSDGHEDGLYVMGTAVYTCLLLTMMYKVALVAQYVHSPPPAPAPVSAHKLSHLTGRLRGCAVAEAHLPAPASARRTLYPTVVSPVRLLPAGG